MTQETGFWITVVLAVFRDLRAVLRGLSDLNSEGNIGGSEETTGALVRVGSSTGRVRAGPNGVVEAVLGGAV